MIDDRFNPEREERCQVTLSSYTHATDMLKAAIEIRKFIFERKKEKEARGETPFGIRIYFNLISFGRLSGY